MVKESKHWIVSRKARRIVQRILDVLDDEKPGRCSKFPPDDEERLEDEIIETIMKIIEGETGVKRREE